MNLLEALAQAQGGQGLTNIASQFGLNPQQTQSAVGALIPQIVAGMKGQSGGLGAIIGMLGGGNHAAAVDDPSQAFGPQGVSQGNEVLGQIFGSKEVSTNVAANVAQQTGIGADILRKMLPVVATMVMGSLAKGAFAGSNAAPAAGGGLGGMLGGLVGSALGGGAQQSAGGGLGGMLGGLLGGGAAQNPAATSMLSSILDANHDGSVMDDLLRMAGGALTKR